MARMSFPDGNPPPPPATPLPLPSHGKNVGDFWTRFPKNHDHSGSHSKYENVPSFKRLRDSANKPPKFGPSSSRNPMMNQSERQEGKGKTHPFYKTRLCKRFMTGTCTNGELCTYAHGDQDMRQSVPNWKQLVHETGGSSGNSNDHHKGTQKINVCKNYYIGEECQYGEKCVCLHERSMKTMIDMARERGSSANIAHSKSELQVPGGHIDAEPVAQAAPVQMKPPSIPGPVSPPADATVGEGRKIPKWKTKKINGLYADWLDGYIPPYEQ